MLEIASIVAPVFLCAALGWSWVRFGRAFDRELVAELNTDIGAPCLILSSLIAVELDTSLLLELAGASALAILCVGVVGALVLRVTRWPMNTYLSPLSFGNSGNMGLPLCLFAFGDTGLALGICYFVVTALCQFTIGIAIWSGNFSFRELLRTPVAYAAVIGLTVRLTETPVPDFLLNTLEVLGGLAIPLMLMTLGASLSDFQVGNLTRTLVLSVVRLGAGFAAGVGVSQLLGLEGVARGVLILQCSMPPAVFNTLLAVRYKREPEQVAAFVVVATLLSFAVLPLVIAFVLEK